MDRLRLSILARSWFFGIVLVSAISAQFDQSSGRDSTGTAIVRGTNAPSPPSMYPRPPRVTKETKERQTVKNEELVNYRDFLLQPKTGIIRLLTAPECLDLTSVEIKSKCMGEVESIRLFATGYSFREKRYGSGSLADLELIKGKFVARGMNLQTIMFDLGDLPLTDASLGHSAFKYVVDFQPETESPKVTGQFAELQKGIQVNNFRYSRSVWVRLNTTYGLRSIAYSAKGGFNVGKRDDVIVAFRVVRLDADGSVTILWKELQRKKAPTLK